MRWTIPNMLTVLRLFAAPGVAVMFLFFARPWADWFALVLFVVAAVTDWFDGYLAREWQQESRFGAMLDPIADKAMVVIALLVITGFSGMNAWILLPATVILFREVFVSGPARVSSDRRAACSRSRSLAKWKTTAQMIAIAVLFSTGIFEHHFAERIFGMDGDIDRRGPRRAGGRRAGAHPAALVAGRDVLLPGTVLLWLAAALTAWTGWDYFAKAKPYLGDRTA